MVSILDIVLIVIIMYVVILFAKNKPDQSNYKNNQININRVTGEGKAGNNSSNANSNNKSLDTSDDNISDNISDDISDDTLSDRPNKKVSKKNNSYIDSLIGFTDSSKLNSKSYKINHNFLNMQFHNDYRDVLTAINNVAPDQKQMFNMGNIPVRTSFPSTSDREARQLITEFIKELNKNIKTEVSDYLTSNSGWDDLAPQKREKSGWEKEQEALGLPGSIYSQPAKRAKLRLIKIDKVQKQETESEIKYTSKIIIRKKNVQDQMVLRVSFVIPKKNIDERKLFEQTHTLGHLDNYVTDNPLHDTNKGLDNETLTNSDVIIEEVFVVGFLSTDRVDGIGAANLDDDDNYNFQRMENNEVTSMGTIMKELKNKYNSRANEMNKFTEAMDKETKDFHSSLQYTY